MNKKNAFIVKAQLQENMALEMESSVINAMLAVAFSQEEIPLIRENFGKNMRTGNRPIIS